MRMRVRKAIAAIKEAMIECHVTPTDRDGVRAWVDAENKAAIAGGGSALVSKSCLSPGSKTLGSASSAENADNDRDENDALDIVEFVRIPADFCLPVQTPMYQDVDADDKKPVPVENPTNFEDFQ